MPQTSLVPFEKVKEILTTLSADEIVQYEGAFCTHKGTIDSSKDEVSIVEVKIAFVRKETQADKASADRQKTA